jgi:hypothetical protein
MRMPFRYPSRLNASTCLRGRQRLRVRHRGRVKPQIALDRPEFVLPGNKTRLSGNRHVLASPPDCYTLPIRYRAAVPLLGYRRKQGHSVIRPRRLLLCRGGKGLRRSRPERYACRLLKVNRAPRQLRPRPDPNADLRARLRDFAQKKRLQWDVLP